MRRRMLVILLVALLALLGVSVALAQEEGSIQKIIPLPKLFQVPQEALPKPPPPEPDYEWIDSGDKLCTLTFEGIEYEPNIVVGAYVPEEFEVEKDYPVYLYVTRLTEDSDVSVIAFDTSTGNMFGVNACAGISAEVGSPKGLSWYIHLGIGYTAFGRTYWDSLWVRHIPISGSPLALSTEAFEAGSVKISPELISYERVSDIPYKEWDGPYTTYITVELAQEPLEFDVTSIEPLEVEEAEEAPEDTIKITLKPIIIDEEDNWQR